MFTNVNLSSYNAYIGLCAPQFTNRKFFRLFTTVASLGNISLRSLSAYMELVAPAIRGGLQLSLLTTFRLNSLHHSSRRRFLKMGPIMFGKNKLGHDSVRFSFVAFQTGFRVNFFSADFARMLDAVHAHHVTPIR